ncbi:MAG: hypothetical protein AAFU65_12675, partial [Pseudomonadota bacterium]
MQIRRRFFLAGALCALSPLGAAAAGNTPAQLCQSAARNSLGNCSTAVALAQFACHQQTGSACTGQNPSVTAALSALQSSVTAACTQDAIQEAGLGATKGV